MRLTVVTDSDSWFVPYAQSLAESWTEAGHESTVVFHPDDIPHGDLAFLLSLGRLVKPHHLRRNSHNLVVHASDLPQGKGWSPVTWQLLQGVRHVPFSLFEAVEHVDAGPIYLRDVMITQGTELIDEIRSLQAATTLAMCKRFVSSYPHVLDQAREQDSARESFYRRRSREDSRIDPDLTIAEQFDLLRTCDPDRYPAHFELRGTSYELVLRRAKPAM